MTAAPATMTPITARMMATSYNYGYASNHDTTATMLATNAIMPDATATATATPATATVTPATTADTPAPASNTSYNDNNSY